MAKRITESSSDKTAKNLSLSSSDRNNGAGFDTTVFAVDYTKGLKRFWYIIIALAVIFGMAAFAYRNYTYVPMYQSSASFSVSTVPSDSSGSTTFSTYYDNSSTAQLSKTFPYIVNTSMMQNALKNELGTDYINASITAEAVSSDSNIFKVTVSGSSPDTVYNVINAVIEVYPDVSQFILGNIRLNILIKPVYPEEPYTSSNIGVFTAEFAAIGALLGLVIVGIYAFFRNTVRVKDDFKNKLNQKCLVEIPRVVFHRKSHTSENEFILITGKHPMFKESFRLLRKRLLKHMDEAGDKILAVTSAAPDEGKTTVALNTAYAISMNGKKTAIVDLDFNKRLLQNKKIEVKSEEDNSDSDDKSNSSEGSFELFMSVRESINTTQKDDSQSSEENSADQREKRRKNEDDTQAYKKGVTDIISEDSPDYRSICHNVDSNLDAYYTGSQEFVFSDSAYRKFFDYLSENYDYVIVNTSPCKNASEAVFVCNMCDDIMFVVKQDSVSVNKIRKSIEYLSFSKAKILGFVFNSVQEGFSGYGGYYYGGKYGYGKYGYGKYGYGRYGYGRRSYGYGGYGRDSEYGYGYGYGYGEYGYGEYGYGYGDEPHRKKSKSKKHKSDEGSDITDSEIPDNNI